ncbi:hypothetical protein ACFWZ2_00815 [Streptomyces sp. NPDC059002]|uniref:hypothetical protein n=1 Tax=Streptomyces sp. NPDC059002 TaxID=3346690 RepID=UPI003694674A
MNNEGRSPAETLPDKPAHKNLEPAPNLSNLTNPTHYTGSATHLTDRALERR